MEKKLKFEEKIKELENIINELENGEVGLEESFDKYTSAMKLVNECDKQLNEVEEKISKIILENGEIKDFKIDE